MEIIQNVAIVTICSGVGMVLKNFTPIKNDSIPSAVAIVGGLIGALAWLTGYFPNEHILECVAIGILSGMSSTGAHQIAKNSGKRYND